MNCHSAHTGVTRCVHFDIVRAREMGHPTGSLATFMCSFRATDHTRDELIGTKERVGVEPGYNYVGRVRANEEVRIDDSPGTIVLPGNSRRSAPHHRLCEEMQRE